MDKLLLAGLFLTRMSFAVPETGTIAGQLRDSSGKPAAGVRVAAAEAGATPTSGVLAAITETDKAGHYQLENIPPGRYHILAGRIDYPTYYPGVTIPLEAKAVEVQAGRALSGIDFSLLRPATVRVSGQIKIKGLQPAASIPVALFGATGLPLKTETQADGSFEFADVVPGNYTLRAPGIVAVNIAAEADIALDLTPLYAGTGVRVSGRVKGKSGPPQAGIRRTVTLSPIDTNPITGSHLAVPRVSGNSATGPLETFVAADGSFEFVSVPPGPYLLRIQPAAPGVPGPRLDIADQDVRGLEITIPFQFDIPGRVQIEGRDIGVDAIIEAKQDNFSTATSVLPDGTFRLRLTEGENQISVGRLPVDFSVKSITYGGRDISGIPLKLDPTASPAEMVVTLERKALPDISGVKVSGRATGPGRQSVVGLTVSLSPTGPAGTAADAIVKEDGYFEFLGVASGTYILRFAAPVATLTRIVVGDTDLTGIEVPVAARVEVAGRVRVVSPEGRESPIAPANLSIAFQVPNGGSASASMAPDRTFRILLPEENYTLLVRNLPTTYTVRSIAAGSLDLLKEPLRIDAETPPSPINIILEYKPAR